MVSAKLAPKGCDVDRVACDVASSVVCVSVERLTLALLSITAKGVEHTPAQKVDFARMESHFAVPTESCAPTEQGTHARKAPFALRDSRAAVPKEKVAGRVKELGVLLEKSVPMEKSTPAQIESIAGEEKRELVHQDTTVRKGKSVPANACPKDTSATARENVGSVPSIGSAEEESDTYGLAQAPIVGHPRKIAPN